MRFQGKITNWNDEKGFGFVEPNGGGTRAFVHIKSFVSRSRRPMEGDAIIYELAQDRKSRFTAQHVKLANETRDKPASKPKGKGTAAPLFALLFCVMLFTLSITGKAPLVLPALYIGLSLITFIAYAIDKSAAQNNRWRTQESTLHLLSLLGGWPGALYAQRRLRHKSVKQEFQSVFWLTIVVNCGALVWLISSERARQLLGSIIHG